MDGRCPGCDGELTSGRLGPIPLALCLPCGGALLASEALRQLLEAGPDVIRRLAGKLAAESAPVPKSGPCPTCHRELAPSTSSALPGVVIHTCSGCRAFWLSRSTLFRIAEAVDQSRSGTATTATTSAPPVAEHRVETPEPKRASSRDTCPECGEANGPSSTHCWACGRILQGVGARACPRCRGIVRKVESHDVTIGACESCGGAWFPPGQLNALLFLPEEDQHGILRAVGRLHSARERPHLPAAECPHCAVPMGQVTMGKLSDRPVPACPECRAHFAEPELLEELIMGKQARPRTVVRVVS